MKERENILTAIVLEKRVSKKDGTFPVKIRITFQRKQKYYVVKRGLSFSENDFEKIMSLKPRGIFKENRIFIDEVERYAIKIINSLDEFSFEEFENQFLPKKTKTNDVISYYNNYIEKLRSEEKYNSSNLYTYSRNAFKEFTGFKAINFKKIKPDLLRLYEKWMLNNNKSYTTISIYMRNLRTIFNLAISDGIIKNDIYPFGAKKYQIPESKNKKKALSLLEIEKLFNYKAGEGSAEERSRDYWIFSYLCNGMNIADVAHLKYQNITDGKIEFYRRKTKSTTKEKQKISCIVTEDVNDIIERWGNKPRRKDTFIFDILTDDMDEELRLKKIKQAVKTINKYIKRIGNKLGIEKPITTYYARHSFSTVLKRSGVSSEFIKESLGHKDLRTTENYLDSFEDEVKVENAKLLTSFKNKK